MKIFIIIVTIICGIDLLISAVRLSEGDEDGNGFIGYLIFLIAFILILSRI